MAVGRDMERITVTLSKRVIERLDEYCDLMGQTRSTAVGSMVAKQLVQDEGMIRLFKEDFPYPDVYGDMERVRLVEDGLIGDDE